VDSTAIRGELGWTPSWDLDRGLEATYAWYRGYLDERG
jgi:nucleoside-diphosphate-sugar epimerase